MDVLETLFIELTSKCNLNCIHCGYSNIKPETLELETIVNAIEKCIPYGLKKIVLTGGEPTLHTNFNKILELCKKYRLKVKLTSNGYMLDTLLEYFNNSLLDEVVISVDAFNPLTYKKIRGYNLLEKIWSDREKLSDFHDKIHFSFLIQKSNYRELMPFLETSLTEKVASVSLLVPHFDGDFTHTLDTNSYYKNIFFDQNDVDFFIENISSNLKKFYTEHKRLFKFSEEHLNAIIDYLISEKSSFETRRTLCSLPLKTLFLYSNNMFKMCPYLNIWTYNNLDEFLKNISKERMKLFFDDKKTNICKHCLEVPV